MVFSEKLKQAWKKQNSLLCVGLDPHPDKIPKRFAHTQEHKEQKSELPLFEFCKWIIDETHPYVCAYKIQIAYFSALGREQELQKTVHYIHKHYPDIIVILDAKRADISATSERYATEVFDYFDADAVTLNPYLGQDSLQPFLDYKNKGSIILCKTSNPGSADFQDLKVADNLPLYQ